MTSRFQISFDRHTITLTRPQFVLSRAGPLFFAWIALLAFHRKTEGRYKRWVDIKEAKRLPVDKGSSVHWANTNIGRNLQKLEAAGIKLVQYKRPWSGPYRLRLPANQIEFDLPLYQVSRRLGISVRSSAVESAALYDFTSRFCRALWAFATGNLRTKPKSDLAVPSRRQQWYLRYEFGELAGNKTFDPALRLLASLWVVRVLDRLGEFAAAANELNNARALLRHVKDPVLRGHFHLAQAWQYSRAGDQQAAEAELNVTHSLAHESSDQGLMGALLDREGWHHAKLHRLREALAKHIEGLKARLLTGDFDRLQVSCHNIGATLEATGEDHYHEAQLWFLLGRDICQRMHVGHDRALAEIRLAQLSLKQKNACKCLDWLEQADKILAISQNQLGRSHYHVVKASYFDSLSKKSCALDELVLARKCYSVLKGYDVVSRDSDLKKNFAEYWPEFIDATGKR